GKFDGFPLVVDAGMCGVAMFVSDPLGQNEDFVPGEDVEVVKSDPADLVERVLPYFENPQKLKTLAGRGQKRIMELRNKEEKLSAKAGKLVEIMSEVRR